MPVQSSICGMPSYFPLVIFELLLGIFLLVIPISEVFYSRVADFFEHGNPVPIP